jgi:hypothetical protein
VNGQDLNSYRLWTIENGLSALVSPESDTHSVYSYVVLLLLTYLDIIVHSYVCTNVYISAKCAAAYPLFKRYKVVSVFSLYMSLALSLITHHCTISQYKSSSSSKYVYLVCNSSIDDLGTPSVQSVWTKHNPGPVICHISPNGD